jgi:hypothetical protein
MAAPFVRVLFWPALLSLCLLAGCASEPLLISKSPAVPLGVDLSGRWVIRSDASNQTVRSESGEERLIPTNRPQRSRRQGSASGSSVQVFLEFGRSLKISQTGFGMFISYDRSIVEEYTFGENRMVSIGPIEAFRVSGWEGKAFVVETADDTRTTLYESWHLASDDTVLIRDLRMSKGEEDSLKMRQVFDRQ